MNQDYDSSDEEYQHRNDDDSSVEGGGGAAAAGEGGDGVLLSPASQHLPTQSQHHAALDWRQDPSESLSDWKIQINVIGDRISQEAFVAAARATTERGDDDDNNASPTSPSSNTADKNCDVYHVHKNIMAVGPRRSEYFWTLFQSKTAYQESDENCSKIDLHVTAAKQFPVVLDYIYNGTLPALTAENCTSLLYLAKYFQLKQLTKETKQFWQTDLNVGNCGTYYEHALIFHDDKIERAVEKLVISNIMSIYLTSRIVFVSGPTFWLSVVRAVTKERKKDPKQARADTSQHLSCIVASFCVACNDGDITTEQFAQLTDSKYLPEIHFKAAGALMGLETKFLPPTTEGSVKENTDATSKSQLSDLQQRCIRALATKWNKIDHSMLEFLSKQNPVIIPDLLTSSIANAKLEYETNRDNAQHWKQEYDRVKSIKKNTSERSEKAESSDNGEHGGDDQDGVVNDENRDVGYWKGEYERIRLERDKLEAELAARRSKHQRQRSSSSSRKLNENNVGKSPKAPTRSSVRRTTSGRSPRHRPASHSPTLSRAMTDIKVASTSPLSSDDESDHHDDDLGSSSNSHRRVASGGGGQRPRANSGSGHRRSSLQKQPAQPPIVQRASSDGSHRSRSTPQSHQAQHSPRTPTSSSSSARR